jgi:hypothetical protein
MTISSHLRGQYYRKKEKRKKKKGARYKRVSSLLHKDKPNKKGRQHATRYTKMGFLDHEQLHLKYQFNSFKIESYCIVKIESHIAKVCMSCELYKL